MNNEPVAIRYDFDGYGYQYMDSGSGSDWVSLNKNVDGELLYTHPVKEQLTDEEKTELENALKVCEYKYFGSYPLSEEQWKAFELLKKHARAILRKAQE